MGEIVTIHSFIEKQIVEHRIKMQELMAEAGALIDESRREKTHKEGYAIIGFALDLLRRAEKHSAEIRRLEAKLLKKTA